MGVKQSLPNTIGVFDSIGPSMVSSVFGAPKSDGALHGTTTNTGKEDTEGQATELYKWISSMGGNAKKTGMPPRILRLV